MFYSRVSIFFQSTMGLSVNEGFVLVSEGIITGLDGLWDQTDASHVEERPMLPETHCFTLRSVDTLLPSKSICYSRVSLSVSLNSFFFLSEWGAFFFVFSISKVCNEFAQGAFQTSQKQSDEWRAVPWRLVVKEVINTLERTAKPFLSCQRGSNL